MIKCKGGICYISKTKSMRSYRKRRSCGRQSTKKYVSRGSPALKANASCNRGTVRRGNDGRMYKSTRNINGVYTWKRLTSVNKRSR